MNNAKNFADKLRHGDADVAARLRGILKLKPNNLVERPWGGLRMLQYKGRNALPDQKKITGQGIGEAFELASCPSDAESHAFPSVVSLPDGSEIALPELMTNLGSEILGTSLFSRFCGEIPLLPKTLDIEELLSVQAHPPGNTELYIIIDATPGATIRLGFNQEISPQELQQDLMAGRRRQERLLELLHDGLDQHDLHRLLAPAMADRDGHLQSLASALIPQLRNVRDDEKLLSLLQQLKGLYWQVLDLMNEIPVVPGQIIYNATPARVCAATGLAPAAEVHALGNPQQHEILMLEIRRPGITYRAWDNVRFPIRNIDIEKALGALHCGATDPQEFFVTPVVSDDHASIFSLVSSQNFVVDQIRAAPDEAIITNAAGFHTLHAINGCAELIEENGRVVQLKQGETAIVPTFVTSYTISADAQSELIRVSLPENA